MTPKCVIQWNCRGLRANYEEIKHLISDHCPLVIALQEIMLSDNDKISFKHFQFNSKLSTSSDGRAIGGVGLLVHNSCYQLHIPLNTSLQAVATQVTLHKPLTICSLYLPPSAHITVSDFENLISQLPPPFLILGDFNAHSQLWGCRSTDARGSTFEDVFSNLDLCLLNNKQPTYLSPATGSLSAIDLSVCSPSIFLDWEWKVEEDNCGSDHFPIVIKITQYVNSERPPRWQLHRADWQYFESTCSREINRQSFTQIENPMDAFTSCLIEIATASIPKSSTKSKHIPKPWFDESCKEAVKKRKLALRTFKRHPTHENLIAYRQTTAQARRIIKIKKKESWETYVSKLNTRTSVKKTWDIIRKISGKNSSPPLQYILDASDTLIKEPKDISHVLGQEFAKNSSSSHYSESFQRLKTRTEQSNLNFSSNNHEVYNEFFTMNELKEALRRASDTAIGPDEIHYQLLKHLPQETLLLLLDIMNEIWQSSQLPSTWKEATIIPIPKPNKDHQQPSNYRPIALTSCLCKTMERMINNRLVWFLEHNGTISRAQSGFRKQRSTLDHLVCLETFIRDGFIRGDHVVSVFFDLEKAYDTTWKYGIMRDLQELGLRGRLPLFIQNFLSDRLFRVRVGSTYSGHYPQEMGVPQGSILSVTLFSIKINNIANIPPPEIDTTLFVDDFSISYRSKNMRSIERHMQLTLNRIQDFADQSGFKFSSSKTVCVHFCQKRGLHPDPELLLYGQPITVVDKVKFLGVILDKKLNFKAHIDYLRCKCLKTLNLLRVVSKRDWGADRETLLRLYRSLVRSKLDYGSFIYSGARPSYLKKLNVVQNQALRVCLGAFRTSPIPSLHVEAGEPPMNMRCKKLALQFALRACSNPENPASETLFNTQHEHFYTSKPNAIRNPALRIRDDFNSICPDTENVAKYSVINIPPWQLRRPTIDTSLTRLEKSKTDPLVYRTGFDNLREKYENFLCAFTDGSKSDNGVTAAAFSSKFFLQIRLPDEASIFTAELYAIRYALDFIASADQSDFILFSDSLSSIQALDSSDFSNPLVVAILEKCHAISERGQQVVLAWCPGHVGIPGNEKVDRLAREAIRLPVTQVTIPQSDFKAAVDKLVTSRWQRLWDEYPENKLHQIQPKVDKNLKFSSKNRREEIIFARLRIGHSYLTHRYLLARDPIPVCIPCDEILTIKHILLDCVDFQQVRSRFYSCDSLEKLYKDVDPKLIFNFLKEVGFYYRV
jgi:ribonuclease HI